MTRRTVWLGLGAALVLGGGIAGFAVWSQHRDAAAFARACLPARPDLAGAHPELRQRIDAALQRVQAGDAVTASVAELAALFQANGFTAEASRCLQALATLQPSEPRWPHRLGLLLADFGRVADARPWLERAVELAPRQVVTRIRLADTLLKGNQSAEAGRHYRAALELDADNPYARLGLARIAFAAGDWVEARSQLESAAGRTGDAVGGDLLATVYERLGDTHRALALRARQKASGAFSDLADPWLEELFADCYDTYRISVASGAAAHRGDTELALRWIERALLLSPDSVPTLFQRGGYRLRSNELPAAERDFRRCTELDRGFSDGWAQLSAVLRRQGRAADADRALADGLRNCPSSPGLHLDFGRQLVQAGQLEGAAQEFRTSLRLRPEEAEAYVDLASVLFQLERLTEAVGVLQDAQLAEPDHPAVLAILTRSAIVLDDQAAARRWMLRVRNQPRIAAETRAELENEFRARFGRAP